MSEREKITPEMIEAVKHEAFEKSHKDGTGDHVIVKGGNTFVATTSEHGALFTSIETDKIKVGR